MENKQKQHFQAFRALFLAPSNYGKSWLISDFLIDHIKKKHFHPKRVVIFSKTFRSDPSQRKLIDFCKEKFRGFEQTNCFENIDIEFLTKLYDVQKMIKESSPQKLKQWCYIMDDQITENLLTDKKSPLNSLYCTQRHFGISSILALQSYRGTLSTVCRNQMTLIAIGRLSSMGQVEDILEDYNQGCGGTKKEASKQIMRFWEDAIQANDNHGFLVVWTTRQYGEGRLQCNFDGKFYDK